MLNLLHSSINQELLENNESNHYEQNKKCRAPVIIVWKWNSHYATDKCIWDVFA